MKIIHCIGALSGGGAETQMNLLVRERFPEMTHDILCLQDSGKEMYPSSVRINTLQSQNVIKKWFTVYRYIKENNPDIVHIWLPAVFHIFLLPALLSTSKIIVGVRGVYEFDRPVRYLHFILFLFTRTIVSNIALPDQKGLFKVLFSKKQYYWIPNAIKYKLKRKEPELYSKDNRIIKLLFVGRLVKEKNIPLLIKGLNELNPSLAVHLDICGTGYGEANIKSLVHKYSLEAKVTFHGHVADLTSFYEAADYVILPSISEGMPNVAFEAVSIGNILILSDIPQHRRWFVHNRNAVLFTNNDVSSLVEKLEEAFEMTPAQKREIINNCEILLRELSIDNYLQKYFKCYSAIIASN